MHSLPDFFGLCTSVARVPYFREVFWFSEDSVSIYPIFVRFQYEYLAISNNKQFIFETLYTLIHLQLK